MLDGYCGLDVVEFARYLMRYGHFLMVVLQAGMDESGHCDVGPV